MTPWVLLVVALAGANLARLGRRAGLVAAGLHAAVLVAAGAGLLPVSSWERFAGAWVAVVVSFVAWKGLALRTRSQEAAMGMGVFVTAALIPFVLLDVAPPTDVRPWIWASAFLALFEPSTRPLRLVIGMVGKPLEFASENYGPGEYIGVLERWIVLVLVARGNYDAMAFVFAAKALVRHKRFEDDPEFAEYFLIGTLTSVLMAIGVAEAVRALLGS